MKKAFVLGLSASLLLFVAASSRAEEKTTTLTGQGQCAKCALKQSDSCQNTITVDEAGKKVTYFIEQNDVAKKFHKEICTAAKEIKATGTVKEADGKKVFVAKEIEVVKK